MAATPWQWHHQVIYLFGTNNFTFHYTITNFTGIAATLLVGGRTAHSAFNIPLNVDKQDFPMCGIKKQSDLAKRLRKCQGFFWDECTMTHKKALEAVNASLQDIRNEVSTTMGGVLLVLAGDFRQTLPIISKGTAADQINACIKRSTLWDAVETMSLTINMRVNLGNDTSVGQFAEQLLKIGNGLYPMDADCKIKIDTSIATLTSSVEELIKNIFPELESNYVKDYRSCNFSTPK